MAEGAPAVQGQAAPAVRAAIISLVQAAGRRRLEMQMATPEPMVVVVLAEAQRWAARHYMREGLDHKALILLAEPTGLAAAVVAGWVRQEAHKLVVGSMAALRGARRITAPPRTVNRELL